LGAGLPTFFQEISVKTIRAMLWGSLKWEDPTLTIRTTGDLIQIFLDKGGTLPELYNKCAEGLSVAGWIKHAGEPQEQEPIKNLQKSG
jgi:hypothetical protein